MTATSMDDELTALAAKRELNVTSSAGASSYVWPSEVRPPKIAQLLLIVALVVLMIEIVCEVLYVGLLAGLMNVVEKTGGEATALTVFLANLVVWTSPFIEVSRRFAFIPCVITYTIFVYCAVRALYLVGARGVDATPLGAAAWSFAPLLNLGMIYSIMRRIWIGSHDPADGQAKPTGMLPWWWGFYLGGNALSLVGNRLVPSDEASSNLGPDRLISAFLPGLGALTLSCVMTIASCLLLIKITGRIVSVQTKFAQA